MKIGKTVAAIGLGLLFWASSNAQGSKPATPQPPSTIELLKRLEFLEYRVAALESRTASRWASIDCNTQNYDEFLLDSSHLPFFAACTKVEPFLEGFRITLRIGNPHSFSFNNVTGTFYFGNPAPSTPLKEQKFSALEGLRAGTWTTVVITVNPAKAEELRKVFLSLSATSSESQR
jgi:hypothetical protein